MENVTELLLSRFLCVRSSWKLELCDGPQREKTVKVWHVKEDPQRQNDVNRAQQPAGLKET